MNKYEPGDKVYITEGRHKGCPATVSSHYNGNIPNSWKGCYWVTVHSKTHVDWPNVLTSPTQMTPYTPLAGAIYGEI